MKGSRQQFHKTIWYFLSNLDCKKIHKIKGYKVFGIKINFHFNLSNFIRKRNIGKTTGHFYTTIKENIFLMFLKHDDD